MGNMAQFVKAKSDQLNGDDLMGGPITIEITEVDLPGGEQPAIIHYRGENGRPYKPGLSMRRVMIAIWGAETDNYIGRRMTLFRDPKVRFGALTTGGIRISHMSNLNESRTMALTEKKGKKGAFTVEPLQAGATTSGAPELNVAQLQTDAAIHARRGVDALGAWWTSIGPVARKALGEPFKDEMKAIAESVTPAASNEPPDDDNLM